MENEYFYKLKISYDGHRYFGFQIQPNVKTVQGELNLALSTLFKVSSKTMGAGRTDAGVHALGQIVKVSLPLKIEEESLLRALNSLLPFDIRVISSELSTEGFIPTVDAKSKTYFYLFSNEKEESSFQKNYMPNITYKLDFDLMKRGASLFVGEHDFLDFRCVGSNEKSTVREIYECHLLGPFNDTLSGIFPSYYKIELSSNGFLKQMVRLIVGTLIDLGRGKLSLEDIEESLNKPTGRHLARVAPASGLYKSQVQY